MNTVLPPVESKEAAAGESVATYLVKGYFFPVAAWGSCWRMARMAVGAVNMETAPCSDRTRKKAPESGVPTGLPCRETVGKTETATEHKSTWQKTQTIVEPQNSSKIQIYF